MKNPYAVKPQAGFSEERRRLDKRRIELGVRQSDIAKEIGIVLSIQNEQK